MTISDEKLSAFLDGELSPQEMANLRERIASDEALAARVEALALVDKQVHTALTQIDDKPIPEEIRSLAHKLDQRDRDKVVIAFPLWKRAHTQLQHYAVAAATITAVVGFVLGQSLRTDSPEAVTDWAAITSTLEQQPGGKAYKIDASTTVTANLTFFNQQGEYCRQFSVNTTDTRETQNIACRRNGNWKLDASIPGSRSETPGDYEVASGPGPIDEIIDGMINGQVFSANQEKAAIDAAWSD